MHPTDWTLRRLLSEAEVSLLCPGEPPDVPVTGLADDSRRVSPGDCFVAVRGTRLDGHAFVGEAIRAGAAAVVVERPVSVPGAVPTVRVSDARSAAAELAAAYFGVTRCRNGRRLRLVGVTGTNGKTTTCLVLQSILQAAGHRTAVLGTIAYDLLDATVPAPLTTPSPIELCAYLSRAIDAGAAYAVMEVSSHALDQHRCDGLSFDAAVFTNLTGDHLDYHGTRERYLRAKKRLFDRLDAEAGAIVNHDDPASQELVAHCSAPVLHYGIAHPRLEVSADISSTSLQGTELQLRMRRCQRAVSTALIGNHNVSNVLAAAATAHRLGIRPDDVVTGIERVVMVRGRLQRVGPAGCPITVLVDYAHTDDALDNVLATLAPLTLGRLICVFGCGGDRDRTKRPRMGAAVGRHADLAVVTSDNPRTEDPQRIIDEILPGMQGSPRCETLVEPDRRGAIRQAMALAEPGDTVLIAGKGHEDYQIVGREKVPFDDVEEATAALRRVGTAHRLTGGQCPPYRGVGAP